MPDAKNEERGERPLVAWLVLTQLRAAAILLDWIVRPSRMPDAGRIVERACRSAALARFPLFQKRLSMMRHTALCARAAGVVAAGRRPLIQSMMFLWLVRTRGYAAQILDLEALDAMRFAPNTPRQTPAAEEVKAPQAATMAGKQ